MSTRERKLAAELAAGIKQFGDVPIHRIKVARCMPEYWVAEMRVPFEPNSSRLMTLKVAYNYQGHFIGDTHRARKLAERGITAELVDPEHTVCSVGRSSKDGKWYGWSHRAIYGFNKGSKVREGDATDEVLPVGFEAIDEATKRQMAVAFAKSVS